MASHTATQAGVRGIGRLNESSLHAALKEWYARPGDAQEALVDGYIVDIVRGDLLIEVQTGGFAGVRTKLEFLVDRHPIRLVYPVAARTWIVRVSPESGEILSRRRSPRRGQALSAFDELVWIRDLLSDPFFALDIVLIEQEDIRCPDGKGSWRRRGVRTVDRRLLSVIDVLSFDGPASLGRLLPPDLERPFTSRALAEHAAIPVRVARRATHTLHRTHCLVQIGRRGRELLFDEQPAHEECVRRAAMSQTADSPMQGRRAP